jgi:hypothetical protein
MQACALSESHDFMIIYLRRIDGLKSGPIFIGDIGDSGDWWSVAKPAIEAV